MFPTAKSRASALARIARCSARNLHSTPRKAAPITAWTVPYVVESSPRGERVFDIFSRLLKERIILLNGEVNDHASAIIVAQLLFCEADSAEKPIQLYLNSPGGSVTAGMFIQSPVSTVCIGQACSMASLLLSAGEPGQRYILPNARVMVHQPSGGAAGQASDIAIHAKEILEVRKRLNMLYVKHTKQELDKIEKAMERDTFMSPEAALEFGLVDRVIEKNSSLTIPTSVSSESGSQ
ncbi:putative ATP-dependent Clp protease proteolytic subunit, mitochondrial-like protein [Cladochytrium replicatum]|nr:putative ATP-dependent Clp protease proteolytic subunit, mitochondrial-like protein [Cladochytrium replicatum]